MRIWIKTGAAVLAFVPMAILLVLIFGGSKFLPDSVEKPIYLACAIFNFPAVSILSLIATFRPTRWVYFLCVLSFLSAWSSFIAWLFWRIAETFMGEDEPEFDSNPERAKFDWAGFRIRFFFGFIIGFLLGWRLVPDSSSEATFLVAMTLTGLFVGVTYGLYRPNFWSRS